MEMGDSEVPDVPWGNCAVPFAFRREEPDLETEGDSGGFLSAGACTTIGPRPSNEDQHVLRCEFCSEPGPPAGLFAVLDGHGGAAISVLASRMLAKGLKAELNPLRTGSPAWGSREQRLSAIEKAFHDLDTQLGHKSVSRDCGSTCVVALVSQGSFNVEESCGEAADTCSVALMNLGDSRGLVVRGGTDLHAEMQPGDLLAETEDHKPNNPGEKARIYEADGLVTGGVGMFPARIDGDLALSRAFGDFRFKDNAELPPHKQKVSIVPEVVEVECRCGDLVVLACDGAFDVLSSLEVAAIARQALADHQDTLDVQSALEKAAAAVVNEALLRRTMDNVTCVVVKILSTADGLVAAGAASAPLQV